MSLGRSYFWRKDISWYGAGLQVDLSHSSRSFAYSLRGSSEDDDDLYVMINASDQPLEFVIQETHPNGWLRIIDSSLEAPHDIVEVEHALILHAPSYALQPRSIVVCCSRRGSSGASDEE